MDRSSQAFAWYWAPERQPRCMRCASSGPCAALRCPGCSAEPCCLATVGGPLCSARRPVPRRLCLLVPQGTRPLSPPRLCPCLCCHLAQLRPGPCCCGWSRFLSPGRQPRVLAAQRLQNVITFFSVPVPPQLPRDITFLLALSQGHLGIS